MLDKEFLKNRIYVAIDLKSFYASVECRDRGLDPLKTNLVVADASRTNKTICLAVSPSLKSFGISGRARLFELVKKVNEINQIRNASAFSDLKLGEYKEKLDINGNERVIGSDEYSSIFIDDLNCDKSKLVDYIVAPPRMATYMKYSEKIYGIYLKYVAPEDIHVYSVDEVFIDATSYLEKYNMDVRLFTQTLIRAVLDETNITATAGIGTNIYLAKIAMDIYAKKIPEDEQGVRIAYMDEDIYKRTMWSYEPITDFWRVGRGIAKRLKAIGLNTMGDIARCSLGNPTDFYNEDLLFKNFGVNAELLIDHAWGYETTTIKDIKSYKPRNTSLTTGQVLSRPYTKKEARVIILEMADTKSMELVEKKLLTDAIVLTVGYDIENLNTKDKLEAYEGEVSSDYYGRIVPKAAHGTIQLGKFLNSSSVIIKKTLELYDKIVDEKLTVRRIYLEAIHTREILMNKNKQLSIFDFETEDKIESKDEGQKLTTDQELKLQEAMLKIREKYGLNAILKASSLKEGATLKERNSMVGGHKA